MERRYSKKHYHPAETEIIQASLDEGVSAYTFCTDVIY